jgi:hypothetical protein
MYEKNKEQIDKIILDELATDPMGRGYKSAGSDKELSDLLNEGYVVTKELFLESGNETYTESHPPRIYEISIGIAFCPNAISEDEITRLLKG